MAKQTTSQKHAKLKTLSTQVKANIYEMLKLTDEILQDHEYVDSRGGELALMDEFEAKEFSHFGGNPSLHTMLKAYRANPDKGLWEEYGYNLRVMIDLCTPEREKSDKERINWKARCAELENKIAALESENRTLRDLIVGQRMQVA